MKVDFLIIGTQKAGTTSLYHYIKQHPEIYFSEVKEVTYFVDDILYEKGKDYYHSFFNKYSNEKVTGSAYVHMLPSVDAPERVRDYNPNMKIIVMLRNPADRAYSAYNYAIKNGWEDSTISFEKSMTLESKRVLQRQYDLCYFHNGLYYKHLINWMKFFNNDNFIVFWDTELKKDPKSVLSKIFKHLDVKDESNNIDTSKAYNKAGKVRLKVLQKFLLNKNSRIKKLIGSFIPKSFKILIRSRLLPCIYSLNQIEEENKEFDTTPFESFFFEDQNKLDELPIEGVKRK